jgi:hypothetical protein
VPFGLSCLGAGNGFTKSLWRDQNTFVSGMTNGNLVLTDIRENNSRSVV